MKQEGCENEIRILEALGQGATLEGLDEPLRRHVASCSSCAELVSVYEMFQEESMRLQAAAPLPEASRIWWHAMLAARRVSAERAMRPILIAEKAALAVGGGVLIAFLVFAAPWLVGQLTHSSAFSRTFVYALPLSSLLTASAILCLVLMAGALCALWVEK